MQSIRTERKTVAVVGLGYVGCVTAACLAELGHRVIGVDRDRSKVHSIMEGRAPFYEPGLEELVRGAIDPASAREQILIATRQYAKRQRTWLRHQLDEQRVTRIDPMVALRYE